MNWKYVKLLLLILLLAVNILLAYFVYNAYSENAFTDTLTASRAVRVLEKSGITVSEELLAVRNDTVKTYSAEYDRENYLLSVATLLLGETPSGVFLTPSGIRAEGGDKSTAFVGNDLSVSYSESGEGDILDGAVLLGDEEASAARIAAATALGYSEDTFEGLPIYKNGDCIVLTFTQKEDGIPLYGAECTFGIADGKIVYARGKHFFGTVDVSHDAPILNRVNILLSERSRQKTGTVEDISLCYTVYEDSSAAQIYLIPSYAVSYTDGSLSVINAADATLAQ